MKCIDRLPETSFCAGASASRVWEEKYPPANTNPTVIAATQNAWLPLWAWFDANLEELLAKGLVENARCPLTGAPLTSPTAPDVASQ